MYRIYTDGSCLRNPGPGGWAAVFIDTQPPYALCGWVGDKTTNNRMELTAAIEPLKAIPQGSEATIYTDSTYLIGQASGQKTQANHDLVGQLRQLQATRKVQWQKVEAHAGDHWNQQADYLARQMMKRAITQKNSGVDRIELSSASASPSLTHLDAQGRAQMVDVGAKQETERIAVAKGSVVMQPQTLELIASGQVEKGDVLAVARIAGINAAKRTWELIPLCHQVPLTHVSVDLDVDRQQSAIHITATAKTMARTGVEMEALTAVAVAALTLYDMCKAVERGMRIQEIRLVRKSGGRSGDLRLE